MKRASLVDRERSVGWESFDPLDAAGEEVRGNIKILVSFFDLDDVGMRHRQRDFRDVNHVARNDTNSSALWRWFADRAALFQLD